MSAISGKPGCDELTCLNHPVDPEQEIRKSATAKYGALFAPLRPLSKVRRGGIVVDVVRSENLIRHSELSLIPEFQEEPPNHMLVFRRHGPLLRRRDMVQFCAAIGSKTTRRGI
jgi:hypothetical protein